MEALVGGALECRRTSRTGQLEQFASWSSGFRGSFFRVEVLVVLRLPHTNHAMAQRQAFSLLGMLMSRLVFAVRQSS